MKNFKFATIIDFISINFLIFLITFTWYRFLTKNALLSFFLAIISMSIFLFFKLYSFKSKKNKSVISKTLKQDIDSYILSLLSNTKKENLEFVKKCIKTQDPTIKEQKNMILTNLNTAYCPIFFDNELSQTVALKHIKYAIQLNLKKIIILCSNIKEQTKLSLLSISNIEVEIIDKNNIYQKFFLLHQQYPKIIFEYKQQKKIKFKQLLSISFSRARSKNYFLSGLFILFYSFFVRLNFYYVFLSTLLFLFALISLTKKTS